MEHYFAGYTTQLAQAAAQMETHEVDALADAIWRAFQAGRQVFLLGNGGSAASASHWVCDFGKGINRPGAARRLRITALCDNTPILTAYGNDVSYDEVFAEQLRNHAAAGDLVVCLSVSGSSPNLVRGLETARELGAQTACVIGTYNGACAPLCDIVVHLPTQNYGVAEDLHMVLNHAISQEFRRRLEAGA